MSYSNQQREYTPSYKIARADGRDVILDFSDGLNAENGKWSKIRVSMTMYGSKAVNGQNVTVRHNLDVDDAKLLFHDLLFFTFEGKFDDYKGSTREGVTTGSVMNVKYDQTKDAPFAIQIATGPGQIIGQGAVKMTSATSKAFIMLKAPDMRKIAISVLDYIRAWEIVNLEKCQLAQANAEMERRNNQGGGNSRESDRDSYRQRNSAPQGQQRQNSGYDNRAQGRGPHDSGNSYAGNRTAASAQNNEVVDDTDDLYDPFA